MMNDYIYVIVTYQGRDKCRNYRAIPVNGISNLNSAIMSRQIRNGDVIYVHNIADIDKSELETALYSAANLLQSKGDIGAYKLFLLGEPIDENGKTNENRFSFLLSVNGQIKQARYVIEF